MHRRDFLKAVGLATGLGAASTVAGAEESRRAGRMGTPGALVSGESWNAFAETIRNAAGPVLAEHAPGSPVDRAGEAVIGA
jgi:hypothetical protein